jgi:cytochrome c-type biogenesis protein CcmE
MIECSSCDESGEDLIERDNKDESEYFANTDEKFSIFISQEEVLPDMIDDSADVGITMDALFSTPSTFVVSNLK